jgi:hypothetical protein
LFSTRTEKVWRGIGSILFCTRSQHRVGPLQGTAPSLRGVGRRGSFD